MNKTILISVVTLFFGLAFTACNHTSTNTTPIESTIPPVIQASTPTISLEELAPTDNGVVPTATLMAHSESLPDLQPITSENAEKTSLLLTLDIPDHLPVTASQCSVAFSPDGRLLVGSCGRNPIPVWDVQSGSILFQLYKDEPKQIVACDFSPDGSIIACGGVDKIITFWNAETGEKISEFGKHNSKIWDLAFSPDGKSLATASFADDVRLWDISSQGMVWSYNGVTNFLSIAYHPSGDAIAYGNRGGKIGVLDAKTGKSIVELSGPAGMPVGDVNFSPSGQLLAAGCDDKKIYLWETKDYQPVATFEGHQGYVNGVNFSPDETVLISGSHDKTVGIWDVAEGQLLTKLTGHKNVVLRVAFSPQGTLIASISWDGTVRLWGVAKE
jgi:WD40 repeat protein